MNEQAQERLSPIVERRKAFEGLTKDLKADYQMVCVGTMNSIRNHAGKIFLLEMIYGEDAA